MTKLSSKAIHHFLLVPALMLSCVTHSQTTGLISYRCISNTDTTSIQHDSTGQEALMYFDSDSSLYLLKSSPFYKQMKAVSTEASLYRPDTNKTTTISNLYLNDENGYAVYKNLDKSKIVERNIILINKRAYIHDEKIPEIDWQLMDSTKTIGDVICQKAVGAFRGRMYTAWFAPSLAVPYGPWKLGGLPGLILEAYDEKRRIQWLFEGLEIPCKGKPPIAKPTKGRMITFLKYQTIEADEFEKARKKFIATNPQARGAILSITFHQFPLELNYLN